MKTKVFFILGLLLFISTISFSQVGINTTTPSVRSILDLTSNDKGFLLPRMTSLQRIAIVPSNILDKGLQVFDTDTNSIWYWDGTVWIQHGSKNIYDSSGDISPSSLVNRMVTFSNGGSLNFDSNTFFIDATNNRVGIGTSSPVAKLTIADGLTTFSIFPNNLFGVANSNAVTFDIPATGTLGIWDNLDVFNSLRVRNVPQGASNLDVLAVDNSGNVSKRFVSVSNQGINLNHTVAVPLGVLITGSFINNWCDDGTIFNRFTGYCILNYNGTFTSLHTNGLASVVVTGNNTNTIRFSYTPACAAAHVSYIQFTYTSGNINVTSDNSPNSPITMYSIR